MRQVGTLPNEQQASRFTDFLTTVGIDSRPEADGDEWVIWVLDEERVSEAQDEYRDFLAQPDDARYVDAASKAESIRRERAERQRAAANNVVEMRGQWKRGISRKAPLTFLIIAAAILAFMLTGFKMDWSTPTGQLLAFAPPYTQGTDLYSANPFHLIMKGQVWRLVTPVFLHGDIWHILFNAYMLYYFGSQMESRRGWVRYLIFFILVAAFSNSAEALINMTDDERLYPSAFGGLSGVVYGLFGYIWMQARFLPKSGFQISQITVIILIGWFFACFTGWVGDIANAAHGAGLFFGVVVGYLPVLFPALEEKI